MKTTRTPPHLTIVPRRAAARHPAVLEILFEEQADGPADSVLIDGIVPLALARQFQALCELHNRA